MVLYLTLCQSRPYCRNQGVFTSVVNYFGCGRLLIFIRKTRKVVYQLVVDYYFLNYFSVWSLICGLSCIPDRRVVHLILSSDMHCIFHALLTYRTVPMQVLQSVLKNLFSFVCGEIVVSNIYRQYRLYLYTFTSNAGSRLSHKPKFFEKYLSFQKNT